MLRAVAGKCSTFTSIGVTPGILSNCSSCAVVFFMRPDDDGTRLALAHIARHILCRNRLTRQACQCGQQAGSAAKQKPLALTGRRAQLFGKMIQIALRFRIHNAAHITLQLQEARQTVAAHIGQQKAHDLCCLDTPGGFFLDVIRQVTVAITEHRVAREFRFVHRHRLYPARSGSARCRA